MFKSIPKYKYVLAILDYLLLLISFLIAVQFRFADSSLIEILSWPGALEQLLLVAIYNIAWLTIFQHFHLYKINVFLMVIDHAVPIFKSVGYGIIGLMILSFLLKEMPLVESRLIIGYFSISALTLISVVRIGIFRNLFVFLSEKRMIQRKVLIIGAGKSGQMMAADLALDTSHGFQVIGFLDDNQPSGSRAFEDLRVLGKIEDVKRVVDENGIEEVLVMIDNVSHDKLIHTLDIARQTSAIIKVSSELLDIVPNKVVIEKYLGVPVISVTHNKDSHGLLFIKRAFDIVFSLAGLVMLFVPMSIIAIVIKMTSKGPVFFKQNRIGKDGKPFSFYKFRSMYVNNDDKIHRDYAKQFITDAKSHTDQKAMSNTVVNSNGQVKKIVNDPRITTIGGILRKTSLDELPQLFNVLKGDMSLVGPRPCMPYEWEEYDKWHQRRLSVTPGCTGLWQVSGRSAVDFNDMVILDLYYIDNMSPLLDVKLILKTIPVMFFSKGGY
ncbi:exopolysaccharide biosynthesis polyprenyl glycosylphosphotransferase [Chloroherpeton thalassium ATCC 35110]|uniref:Exopolysaccharide biosynthesis polyprenyl glycosylphosphotransferase n=1 Tax=Chloroherpeton thalassium (strain ATCC 35110 / GB-78) TaxID=517418 RepID=B3QU37_CHLT3|nr:sugar transferase [Chloroherpeton thalassium]ACF12835.1 exopolysaccharide biosynthesis polyprenyl glycosylphosphotransferase [Chloroherpeton thalassium ATCC 35110]